MQIADSVLESLSVFYEIKKVTWKFTVFVLLHEESSDCMCAFVWSTNKAVLFLFLFFLHNFSFFSVDIRSHSK